MPDNKKNFLKKQIHADTIDSVLLICAPCSDDADNEWITEAGIHNALVPFRKWFSSMDTDYQFEINYGNPWDDSIMDGMTLYVNVIAKASLRTRPWKKEDMMMFKLKFSDKLPIKDLSSYIKDALTD